MGFGFQMGLGIGVIRGGSGAAPEPDAFISFTDPDGVSIHPNDPYDMETLPQVNGGTITGTETVLNANKVRFATTANFNRLEQRNLASDNTKTYVVASTLKPDTTTDFRFTLKFATGAEHYVTYTWATDSFAQSGSGIANGVVTNARSTNTFDGARLVEFDYAPATTSADWRIGVGTGLGTAAAFWGYTFDVADIT